MEEADGRLILHVRDMACHGFKNVLLCTNDTDVVVLTISFFHVLQSLGLTELWILFGSGRNQRYLQHLNFRLSTQHAKTCLRPKLRHCQVFLPQLMRLSYTLFEPYTKVGIYGSDRQHHHRSSFFKQLYRFAINWRIWLHFDVSCWFWP